MASSFPGTLDSFATDRVDATVMATNQAADHNNYADAIAKIETKVGTGSSTPVANSVLASTGTGVSAWATEPTVLSLKSPNTSTPLVFKQGTTERMRIHTDGALWWDDQGLFASSFLTDSRINVRGAETAVRSNYVYGISVSFQTRSASTLGERVIGIGAYMEDASVTDKTITNAVDNGSGLIRLTVTGHGYSTGNSMLVWGVGGVTNANAKWIITVIDANTIDLQSSTFAGAYTSGGTMSNRAPYDAIQAIVAPSVTRGTGAGTLNYDDANCFRAHNAGTAKAADAIWVDANDAIVGSAFYTILGADADADVGIWLDGVYTTAIQVSGNYPVKIGVAPATAGLIRLPNNQSISARNAANSADVNLVTLNASDSVEIGSSTSLAVGTGFIQVGTTPATAGLIRIPNDQYITGRNAANSADVSMLKLNSANEIQIDPPPRFMQSITISDTRNVVFSTGTGTKFGTATGQKIGFWNATPVIQHSGTGETVGFVAGAGTAVNDQSTFTGNVGTKAYRISDVVKALKNCGIMAPS